MVMLITIYWIFMSVLQPPLAVNSSRVYVNPSHSSQTPKEIVKIKFNFSSPRLEPTTMLMPSQC